jgi:hypothetical protein
MMPRVSSFPFFCIVSHTLLWNRRLFPFLSLSISYIRRPALRQ